MAESDQRTIGEIISDGLVATGFTVRGLARDIAGPSADHREVERIRRRLYRYLDDSIPDEAMAAQISRRLKVPAAALTRPATERAGRGRIQKLERRLEALEAEWREADANLTQLVEQLTRRVDVLEPRAPKARTARPRRVG